MKKMKRIFYILILIVSILTVNTIVFATELENNIVTEPTEQEPPTDSETSTKPVQPTEPETPQEPETPEKPAPETPQEPIIPDEPLPEDPPESQQPVQPETPQEPSNSAEPEAPEVVEPIIPEKVPPQNNNQYIPTYVEKKSNNSNLSRLEVVGYTIEPEYAWYETEYYLIVDLTVEELEVIAEAEHANATVDISGNTELQEGENTIIITVTAEDKSEKKYTIHVTKTDDEAKANANLKNLEIKGFTLTPSFINKIYKYNLVITEDTSRLDVIAEPENDKALVEITGNENLQGESNIITITVTAEDGITKREYKISTLLESEKVEIIEENKMPALIAIAVCLVAIIVLIIYIVKKRT